MFRVCFLILIFFSTAGAESPWKEDILIGSVHTIVDERSRGLQPGDEIARAVEIYDKKNRKIESQRSRYKVDGSVKDAKMGLKYVHTYDSKMNEETITIFSSDGSLFGKNIISYGDRGEVKEKKDYFSDGSLRFRRVITYDSQGREIEDQNIKGDGTLLTHTRTSYKFDKNGKMVSTAILKEPGIEASDSDDITSIVATFDEHGNKAEQIVSINGSFKTKVIYHYDEKDAKTEDLYYNKDGLLREKLTYAYEFDSVGNWTKKSMTQWVRKGAKLTPDDPYVIKRTITYK